MSEQSQNVNVAFTAVVCLLAAAGLTAMYQNRNQPAILEAPAVSAGATGQLPEGHPPVDTGAQTAALEEAVKRDPTNADLRTQLGNLYYDGSRFDKAIEEYTESLRIRPGDPHVETDLATSYHYVGQHDRALEALDNVLRHTPGFAQALYNKGVVLQAGKNDAAGAAAAWEELLRSNPDYPQKADLEARIRQLRAGR